MKQNRHTKIVELIEKYEIETQEELADRLNAEGFKVTQATVSRDIKQLRLTKVQGSNGKQHYTLLEQKPEFSEKYVRVLSDGLVSMDIAQNILVIKTISGMANAVAAAIDAMKLEEIVGSLAGDDTIMCVTKNEEEAFLASSKIHNVILR